MEVQEEGIEVEKEAVGDDWVFVIIEF